MMTASAAKMNRSDLNDSVFNDLVDELTARLQANEPVDIEAFVADHPNYAESLRRLLPALQVLADLSHSREATGAAPPTLDLTETGTLGDFRIIREVGRGGMGVVYEAEQISLGRRVALKVLPFAATMDPRHLQRFQNEARAAASLEHHNIVPVYGVGCERGVHYYAMKFIEGQTLAQLLSPNAQSSSPSPLVGEGWGGGSAPTIPIAGLTTEPRKPKGRDHYRRIAQIVANAADALEYAHSMGVVHRDVKPGNLILDEQGKLWVADFGLAKFGADAGVTMTGDLLGTLRYMSPEQALAKHGLVDHRTDIYSLGATLYELLTKQPAVPGDDKQEVFRRICFNEPIALCKLDKTIPAELEIITLKCLAKEPAERYATAKELAADLRRWLDDKPIRAKPPGLRERTAKWAWRHRAIAGVSIGFLTVAMIGLSVGIVFLNKANREEAAQRARAQGNMRLALAALDDTMWPEVHAIVVGSAPVAPDKLRLVHRLLDFYDKFATDNGSDPVLRLESSKARLRAGDIYKALGQRDRAEQEIRAGVALAEDFARERPEDTVVVGIWAQSLRMLGSFLAHTDRHADAEPFLRKSIEIRANLNEPPPNDVVHLIELKLAHSDLGIICGAAGRNDEAADSQRRAIEYAEQLLTYGPESPPSLSGLGADQNNLAEALLGLGRIDEAAQLVECAILNQRRAIKHDPRNPGYRLFLGNHFALQGDIAQARKQTNDQTVAARELIETMEELVAESPSSREFRDLLLIGLVRQASLESQGGKPQDSARDHEKASKLLKQLTAEFPADDKYRSELNRSLFNLSIVLHGLGREADALTHLAGISETSKKYAEAARLRTWIRLTAADHSLRDPSEALRLATRGVVQHPASGDWHLSYAWAQHQNGDSKAALATLEKAAKTSGGDIDLFFVRAMVLHRLGERDQARQQCIAAIETMDKGDQRNDATLRVVRAEALRELGLQEAELEKQKERLEPKSQANVSTQNKSK